MTKERSRFFGMTKERFNQILDLTCGAICNNVSLADFLFLFSNLTQEEKDLSISYYKLYE